jgi:hypothetical protein
VAERVEVAFPPAWTPHGSFEKPPKESAVTELWDDDGKCRGALFALRFDGVRMLSLSWEGGGARFARITRENDWALEESFKAEPPSDLTAAVDRAWNNALALLIAAAQQARRATGANSSSITRGAN